MSKPKKKVDPTYTEPVLPENIDELKAFALKAHADLYERTTQRDNLSKLAKDLSADLDTLRDSTEAVREQEIRDLRIRQQWAQTISQLRTCLRKTISELPLPADTRVFESDDWELIDDIQTLIQRFLSELQQVKNARFAITYIEATNER